jgi:hypothetical protein
MCTNVIFSAQFTIYGLHDHVVANDTFRVATIRPERCLSLTHSGPRAALGAAEDERSAGRPRPLPVDIPADCPQGSQKDKGSRAAALFTVHLLSARDRDCWIAHD